MAAPPLSGIIPPLLSPLISSSRLDGPALERLIDHVLSGGVSGIFLLGSTGEGPALGRDLRSALIHEGTGLVAGRVPVLINISSTSYRETIRYAELAGREGADYVVLSPPFYYGMNYYELLHFYRSVADHSPLPLVIYNAPPYTGTAIEAGIVEELQEHPRITGIKDSSGNAGYIRQLLHLRTEKTFPILIGPELLLGESLLLGCDGGIPGGANLYPDLYVDYFNAVMARNREKMEHILGALQLIQNGLYSVAGSPMGIIIRLKYLLSRRGLCSGQMAMPVYQPLSPEQKNSLDQLDKEILNL